MSLYRDYDTEWKFMVLDDDKEESVGHPNF